MVNREKRAHMDDPIEGEHREKEMFGLQKLGINIVQRKNEDNTLEEDIKENR